MKTKSVIFLLMLAFITFQAQATHLRIHVSDSNGESVSGVTVTLQSYDGDDWSSIANATEVDAGLYDFDFDIAPGSYFRLLINGNPYDFQLQDEGDQQLEIQL